MHRVISYIKYLIKSIHLHGIHSPFVFEFQHEIIKSKFNYYCFDEIESLRAKLLLTDLEIDILDLGAGSKSGNTKKKKISHIARTALKKHKYAQILFRIAHRYQAQNILEIGTSLGVSTCYLAKSNPKAKVVSLEGSPEVVKIAKINFEKLNIENIELIEGDFKDTLSKALSRFKQLDLAFFDGNHQKNASLSYFDQCLEKAHENSIFVFDDIYWSSEMTEAWEQIKKHPKISVSIDLFEMGIVFFRKDQEKQDFTIYH